MIGLPLRASGSDGTDALLSTVMMPPGVPVATVGIDGAKNAALLALEILAVGDAELARRLDEARERERDAVLAAGREIYERYQNS